MYEKNKESQVIKSLILTQIQTTLILHISNTTLKNGWMETINRDNV